MINESFLQSAVNIRRKYLKVSNNMSLYHNRAKEVIKILEDSIEELERVQSGVESKKIDTDSSITKIIDIMRSIEEEGQRLEELVEPMNKEIEKLAKEESELYRLIREKHSDLSESEIIESVKKRLIEEGI